MYPIKSQYSRKTGLNTGGKTHNIAQLILHTFPKCVRFTAAEVHITLKPFNLNQQGICFILSLKLEVTWSN